MKTKFNILFVCIYSCLNLIPSISHSAWPEFFPPEKELLLKLKSLDTKQCPQGQAKLASNVSINISQHLCKTSCPTSWSWIARSDEQCHDLADYHFKKYDITYSRDKNGTTSYSSIRALYKSTNLTEFLMITVPHSHWHCYEIDPATHVVSCANDI